MFTYLKGSMTQYKQSDCHNLGMCKAICSGNLHPAHLLVRPSFMQSKTCRTHSYTCHVCVSTCVCIIHSYCFAQWMNCTYYFFVLPKKYVQFIHCDMVQGYTSLENMTFLFKKWLSEESNEFHLPLVECFCAWFALAFWHSFCNILFA